MQSGSEPSLGQIAEALVLEEGKLVTLLQAAQRTLSLDSPVTDTEDGACFAARLEDRSVPRPEEVLAGASLLEVGRKHGLSKERVRQIEKKALRKIRAADGARQLKV
jgi:DNA-directed RNA polymerase sigma subunit (sigma70/sigma32)